MERSQFTVKVAQCMQEVAQRNDTVRFIKMDNAEAEMTEEGLPAVLAYKHGKNIAMLVPLQQEFSEDTELTAVSLETVLRQ